MPTIFKFEELEIWKQARLLSLKIFKFTQKEVFIKEYSLKSR